MWGILNSCVQVLFRVSSPKHSNSLGGDGMEGLLLLFGRSPQLTEADLQRPEMSKGRTMFRVSCFSTLQRCPTRGEPSLLKLTFAGKRPST